MIEFGQFTAQAEAYLLPQSQIHGRIFDQFSNARLVEAYFELIDAYDGRLFLELGAHRAMASRQFMRAKPGRRAIAVEANPFNHAKYKENVERGGTRYKNLAITDATGPVKMVLSDNARDRKRGHTRTNNSLLRNLAYDQTKEIEVPGVTLDDMLEAAVAGGEILSLDQTPPFLWIDVEGATSQLIKGGTRTLPHAIAVFVEVEAVPLFEGQVTVDGVADQFAALGFDPFLRDCEYQPDQYNIVFLNRAFRRPDLVDPVARRFVSAMEAFTAQDA